jgi:hypothetical protein
MKKSYLCPECRSVLNPHEKLIFVVRNGEHRGLILLSAKPGDYRLIVDEDFPLQKGDLCEFFCPVCGSTLTSQSHEHFCELLLDKGEPVPSLVEFSRVYGKHATFILDGRDMTAYGEDIDDFEGINFFGA